MLGLRAMNRAIQAVAFALLLTGCGHDIWNAGDLVKWVRNEAVKNGCDPASVQLADWYVAKKRAERLAGRVHTQADRGVNEV